MARRQSVQERLQAAPLTQPPLWRVLLSRYWAWAALVLILVCAAGIRYRLRDFPLERDEGEYAYMGQLILQGIPPYADAYNMKFPGVYAAYALIMAAFGQTPSGIHTGIILINAGAIVLVFLIGRRLSGGAAGAMAAAAYAIMAMSRGSLGLAGHATHFVVLPMLGAALLMLKLPQNPRPWRCLLIGLLMGIAVLMKQPAALFVLMALLYIAWVSLRPRPVLIRQLVTSTAMFVIGVAVPLLLAGLVLWRAGVFGKFWHWTIVYARAYGSQVPLTMAPEVLSHMLPVLAAHTWPLWALAGAGLLILCITASGRKHLGLLAGFTAFSFLAVCPGLYFRNHYFILLMPAAALLIGVGLASLYLAVKRLGTELAVVVPLLLFAGASGYALQQDSDILFRLDPQEACRQTYGTNPFTEAQVVASYIESHTAPSDTIAVLGSEPEIYFYAHRRSATGYIYMYPLMEAHANALPMQKEMAREIEAANPRYIVIVNVFVSWLRQDTSEKYLAEWFGRYATGYEQVGIVDIYPDGDNYRWDSEAVGAQPRSEWSILVLRRK